MNTSPGPGALPPNTQREARGAGVRRQVPAAAQVPLVTAGALGSGNHTHSCERGKERENSAAVKCR